MYTKAALPASLSPNKTLPEFQVRCPPNWNFPTSTYHSLQLRRVFFNTTGKSSGIYILKKNQQLDLYLDCPVCISPLILAYFAWLEPKINGTKHTVSHWMLHCFLKTNHDTILKSFFCILLWYKGMPVIKHFF